MQKNNIDTAIKLYKYLVRSVQKLPEASQQEHYKSYVRNQYRSHSDETDPERIRFIINRAIENSKWILDKYLKKQ